MDGVRGLLADLPDGVLNEHVALLGHGLLDERGGDLRVLPASLRKLGFELIAQGHQFIDFGDDAVLFCQRRHRNQHVSYIT
jgi:hypothetical protein